MSAKTDFPFVHLGRPFTAASFVCMPAPKAVPERYAFWFGTGSQTQKTRNLAKNPNCIVGTQNVAEAVILEGVAEIVTDAHLRRKLKPASLRKYGVSGGDGSEPVYRVRPRRAFGLIEKTFPKTATRGTFE